MPFCNNTALENLRKRLLDLTARNRLINFRHTKRGSLRIINELSNQLVERLLAETEMRFRPVSKPNRKELIAAGYIETDEETGQEVLLLDPTAEEWAKHLGLFTTYEVPEPSTDEPDGKHADTAIQTLLYPHDLEVRLKNLLQITESAIQEMGANILYLALGFLEWSDNSNDNARIAPLFLVPVRLRKGRLNPRTKTYEYTLSYSGEDIIPNLSLREKLRIDFSMALPDMDENTDTDAYFEEVLTMIQKNQPHWRLRRFITLTLLNFSKLLMYLDLDPSRWPESASITSHPMVTRFLEGYSPGQEVEKDSNEDLGFGEEYPIDEIDDIHANYPLIDDADSSQHSALIDATDGRNLVIEGPPGTGKSQTITNLIAAAMAKGKRVLFVAEKLAALEVVRRRLDAAGLGEFCLELHSHKSQKRKVLDEIEERLNKHGHYKKPGDIQVDIVRYEELKTALKEHVERINRPWKNTGRTLHEIFMAATRYREKIGISPDALHPQGYDGDNLDAITCQRTKDQVATFRKVHQAVAGQLDGDLQQHPWYGVRNADLQIFDLGRVKAALEEWQNSLQNLSEERITLAKGLNCEQDEIADSLNGILLLLADMERLPVPRDDDLLYRLPMLRGEVLDETQQYLKLFESIQSRYATLAEKLGPEILQDLSVVDGFLAGIGQLRQLVGQTVKLGRLAETVSRLTAIQDQLAELDEPLKEIRASVDKKAARHLMSAEAGLTEFRTFINLVDSLNPSCWKLRDELFDNEELDELLPVLRVELEQLYALHNELQGVFSPDDLPSQDVLRQLKETLDAGGVFRWLKSSWRTARKQALSYTTGEQIKFSALQPLLDKAAEFAGRRCKLDGNHRYKEAFGDHLAGLDTDLAALESLRDWYRKVRQQYGVGFGQKVALGNAILNLPIGLARGVRSLSRQGVQQQVNELLDDLVSIKEIFAPVSELQTDTTLLTGKEGAIAHLQASLDKALLACGPLATDNAISIAELGSRIELLDSLKKDVYKWETTDSDNKLFQGRLGLKPGLNADNTSSLSMLRNTLAVATCVDQQLTNEHIRQRIYDQPAASTFSALAALSGQLRTVVETQTASYEAFARLTGLDPGDWMNQSGDQTDDLIIRNTRALNNSDTLQNWLDYVRMRDQLASTGLVRLAERVEQGDIDIQQVEDAHQAGVFDMLAREILGEHPELGRFSGHSQEALQDQFKEYDNKLKRLQCEQIAWQTDQVKVPMGKGYGRVSNYTERCLLEHECSKKTRHLPIRQLLHRAGKALVALKPCFMMGPMSVAQYLAPGQIEFDLVVMDEASQIKPQDALGAVARGSQLVVVGDPRQLPPTRFFERVIDDDEEDPTAIEESESILDATLPIFPVRRLRWHYRSQHESLIAFSNHSFYESNLVLFPSPYKATDTYGIEYSRLSRGCFVNRRNMEEAKIISEAVREHFRHHPEESLGVVTMSAEQRMQTEQAIETLVKEDTDFRKWLEKDACRQESLFIKNLENVQGDERDVIFISMTYGPQKPGGRVFQRFGPINSNVGWRRLNVLFTRSKKRMHVFSSMGSNDIIAGSAPSESKRGVQALRDFLSFCETGILHKTERPTGRAPGSDFEIAVKTALLDKGFECVPQVGAAGFFIDVAVVDPGNPGRYLMGIECDGATYHSAKSVRDRDRLRQMILERLGWRVRRIWSTDWFKNPHAELQPIVRELNALKTERIADFQPEAESEADEIVKEVEEQEAVTEKFKSEEIGIRDKLAEFEREVIRKELPDTPENQRLLRPAMIEAFLEYLPLDTSEFLEFIPYYLRQSTSTGEGKFIKGVLEIINESFE